MNLFEQIKSTFHENNISPTEVRLLLAVSGGKDSMVLMTILEQVGVYFEVAHMNYQLREEASNLDEALVRKICQEKEVKCHVKKVDTKSFCETNKMSTQEAARVLRYEWFESLLKNESLDYITTAHHAADNQETFLQNLKRGSGLRGLKGMVFLQNRRCKPMISITRKQIDDFANAKLIQYRNDASNNQNHYQRNLIRNKILPSIEIEMPGFKKGLSKSITNLQHDFDYLIKSLENESKIVLEENGTDFIIRNYKNQHPRLILHLLEKFGFNESQCFDVLNANQAGKQVKSESHIATINDGNLLIHQPRVDANFLLKIESIGQFELDDCTLSISESERPVSFSTEKSIAWIDGDKLKFPLEIRTWQHGDRFQPLGMKGTKKVSDYLTDQKIPLNDKASCKVLISSGKIAWVLGECLSDHFKITEFSKKVVKLETIIK